MRRHPKFPPSWTIKEPSNPDVYPAKSVLEISEPEPGENKHRLSWKNPEGRELWLHGLNHIKIGAVERLHGHPAQGSDQNDYEVDVRFDSPNHISVEVVRGPGSNPGDLSGTFGADAKQSRRVASPL